MSQHFATIAWARGDATFTDNRYSRSHLWRFDGGSEVRASASPDVVPLPWSDPAAVDPEEAFVAAVASCHMLWFLSLAAKAGWQVDRYEDAAVGTMGEIAKGRLAIIDVELRPRIDFTGPRQPAKRDVDALHEAAHERCFIANSIRSTVRVAAT